MAVGEATLALFRTRALPAAHSALLCTRLAALHARAARPLVAAAYRARAAALAAPAAALDPALRIGTST